MCLCIWVYGFCVLGLFICGVCMCTECMNICICDCPCLCIHARGGQKKTCFFCCCCFVLLSFCLNLILKDRLSVYWKIISAQLSGHNNFCDLFVSFLEAEIYNISTLTVHSHKSWGLKLCFHVYIESSFSKQTIFYCLSTVPEWRNITIRAISQFP